MILCDHGADVIKIEPPSGEHARNAVAVDQYGNSLFFAAHNRGKRAVALDLGHADAKKVLDPLLKWADVIITNYGPGVPDKLGFGFERLQEINPRAILVHITGYGSWSDKKKYVAFDGIIQAMSGVWNLNGHPDGPPLNCQVLVGDHGTAAHAANAALCALVERGRTGKGQFIEVGMLEVLSSMLNSLVPDYEVNGEIPRALRPAAVRSIRRLVQGQGRLFHGRAGHAENVEGPVQADGASGMGRSECRPQAWLYRRSGACASRSTKPSRNGLPSARRRRRSSPSRSSAFQAGWSAPWSASSRRRAATRTSRVLTKVKLPNNPKPVTVPGRSFRFPDETTEIKSAPALNQDTFEVLAELGLSSGELDGLVSSGVLARNDKQERVAAAE